MFTAVIISKYSMRDAVSDVIIITVVDMQWWSALEPGHKSDPGLGDLLGPGLSCDQSFHL